MFLELTKKMYESMKPQLQKMGVEYEISDCTIPGDEDRMVHLEITTELSTEQVRILNDYLDALYGENTTGRTEKDKDGNGLPDRLEETGEIVEVRRRKWDDKMHTPGQELRGYITGANTEEEVSYDTI